jgi:antitoxin ParD1/3/4
MPSSYTLGKHFETFVQAQLSSGRYNNASEVLRDALRLMEDRERRLAALDDAVARGVADIDAGEVSSA